jgi:phage recombination protein Bet
MTSPEPIDYSQEKIDLIKRTIAQKASDDELALFLHQAKKTGLDPLAKQIHCVMRYDSKSQRYKMSIQTAIDGYRLIADRTDKYAGSDDYLFDEGLTQFEHIQTGKAHPITATVTVYKIAAGVRCPFTATAVWSSYFPGDKQGFMWRKMPYLMLGKCAEALALRKAFPAELSGVYVREEMEQAGFIEAGNDGFNQDSDVKQTEQKAKESMPEDESDFMFGKISEFFALMVKYIDRYENEYAVKGALKKIGINAIPKDWEGRFKAYQQLKKYASYRDSGMDDGAAVDAIINVDSEVNHGV